MVNKEILSMIVVYTRQPTDDQDAHDTHTHETTDDDRE